MQHLAARLLWVIQIQLVLGSPARQATAHHSEATLLATARTSWPSHLAFRLALNRVAIQRRQQGRFGEKRKRTPGLDCR